MFPELYAPNVLRFQGSMLPMSYLSKALCSQGPMFPRFYIPRALFFQGSVFTMAYVFPRLYVPKTLCFHGTIPQGSTVMYYQGSMLAGPDVTNVLYSQHLMYPRPYILKTLCSYSFVLFFRKGPVVSRPMALWGMYVPKALFSPCPLIPQSYFPRTLCSHSSKSHSFTVIYILRVLCYQVHIFHWSYVHTAQVSFGLHFQSSVPIILCS